ncbi:MAG: Ig-like domain-containing protein, partial [SAR324 cluster bacterium]|nr:Ig-like domain-containing protein [SAR324 cluster bacterium]
MKCSKFSRTITARAVQMFSPKKITQYFTAVLILPAILLSTCSETSEYGDASDYEKLGASDRISPTITSVSPTDNSSDVSVSTTITATLSEKISTGTVTTNTSDTTCSGSFQLSSDNFSSCIKMSAAPSVSNDDKTFSLTPADNLSGRTTYKLKLTTSVKDNEGNALENAYTTTNGFITYYNRFTFGSGIISGAIIRDNGSALSGVDVEYDIGEYTKTVNSDSDGDYGIYSLTSGSYTLTYSKSGFQGTTQSATLASDTDNITVATLTMCPSGSSGGNISGQIKNAVTRDNVSDVLVRLREGLGNESGSTVSGKTATTASDGTYTISSVDAGSFTAEASKSGFITSYFNISSCNGATNQNTNMSETLPDGAMRIVLTWRGIEDFDSHLEIPVSDAQDGDSDEDDSTHLWYSVDQPGGDVSFTGASDATTADYHI